MLFNACILTNLPYSELYFCLFGHIQAYSGMLNDDSYNNINFNLHEI